MFVGVVGFIGSGKGKVKDILSKYSFEKISFGTVLKM
jgi:dephospho-CoA kinase